MRGERPADDRDDDEEPFRRRQYRPAALEASQTARAPDSPTR